MAKGNVYLWTGEGGGKSTSAFGVAIRAIGHKKKVIIVQFMKGRKDIGEYKIKDALKPYYNIRQFGSEKFINLDKPSKEDKKWAAEGMKFAKKMLKEQPFLLILDEINLAAAIGLVKIKEVIKLIKEAPKNVNIYMTGRSAPKEFIAVADYVTRFTPEKHPKVDFEKPKEGIDY